MRRHHLSLSSPARFAPSDIALPDVPRAGGGGAADHGAGAGISYQSGGPPTALRAGPHAIFFGVADFDCRGLPAAARYADSAGAGWGADPDVRAAATQPGRDADQPAIGGYGRQSGAGDPGQ